MKTTETSSYKFEQQISNQINKWLEQQTDEKFKNLSSTKYTGDEEKYFSDVFIENKENGRRIWVEVKKMKNSCLGNPSFKYTDGKWSCTTTDDDNQLTDLYLGALTEGSKKFIDFCKSYLKTDDISIPKDLTPQLINAWKKSGSVEDTDNDVQFITNKIVLDDFGSKITEFYKTVKNEPVYYMQVDDDLYILDPQYNTLGLKTNDGKDLKLLSDVYKHGRVQFRAKGIEKKLKSGSKYYYNIVCDIKITSNESDDIYKCSFKSEDKWPKVKTTDDVLMESIIESIEQDRLIFSNDVDEKIIRTALDTVKIDNQRYRRANFTKYFGQDNIKWCTLSVNTEIVAIAAVEENNPFNGYVYINDIQALIKGYGKTLLDEIFNNYKKVWLMADVTAGEDLLNYYRGLKLHEIIVPDSIYECPAFFYCTKQCDIYKLEDYVEAFFANNNGEEELDEAKKDIGGKVSDYVPDSGTKIWIDDIREAPEGFKWFKTVKDFIEYCYKNNGIDDVSLIDTDHDAGEQIEHGGNYINCFKYLDQCGCDNLTIHIHSSNPIGANAIRSLIKKNKERGWKEIKNNRK